MWPTFVVPKKKKKKKKVKNIKPPNKYLTTTMPTVTYQATASNDYMDPTDQIIIIIIINNYMGPEESVMIFPYVSSCCA